MANPATVVGMLAGTFTTLQYLTLPYNTLHMYHEYLISPAQNAPALKVTDKHVIISYYS